MPQAMPRISQRRLAVSMTAAMRARVSVLPPSLEENAALLGAVRRWRGQGARHWGETPLLDVCLDEYKAGLAKVDVDDARPIGTDGREEILRLQSMHHVF